MTALAAISDNSNIADGLRGWLFVFAVVAIGLAVATILALVAAPHNVPVMGDELSTLDLLDRPRCTVPFCNDSVQIHLHVGHDYWPFCITHGTPYLTEELAS